MTRRRRPRIGLALGSGGARGWSHIGALRALDALGVRPDFIAGASMGALVGAAHAGGKLSGLEDWARGLTLRGLIGLTDLRLGEGIRGGRVISLIRDLGLADRIEDLPIPYIAVATDLTTGKEVWLREGPLAEAVRGSVAIPGLFTPHQLDDRWLIDGGIVNPVPVSVARAMGADVVIAINPNAARYRIPPGDPTRSRSWWRGVGPAYGATVMASLDMMTDHIRRSRLAGDPPEIILNATLGDLGVLELHRAAEAIAEGERIVAAKAERIREVCGI